MLFNSSEFVVLVLLTAFIYYLPALKIFQRHVLILASFLFYAANQPVLLLLLLFSININTITSYFVHEGNYSRRKTYAAVGVTCNLVLLAFFKYGPLFGQTLFEETSSVGEFLSAIPLPIGISFFTFQGITLLIDTLRNEDQSSSFSLPHGRFYDHSLNATLYISFFPQLVAGPIVKAHEFLPQITGKRFSNIEWAYCFRHLVLGYFLKMVVADSLNNQTFWIAFPYFENFGSITLVAMLFAYSMQIFADFAGYSLIAIGVAGLFGYILPENFNFPYISCSFSEFWRRWHISLSSFLKEYLYFPLGGNRKGNMRTYMNLMIVMLLGGLWHGAAWSYMVWGGFHGLALAIERLLSSRVNLPENIAVQTFKAILVFSFVTFAWLLFKLPDFSHVILYVNAILKNTGPTESVRVIGNIIVYSMPVVIYHFVYLISRKQDVSKWVWLKPVFFGMMLFLIITNSAPPSAFVYFQF